MIIRFYSFSMDFSIFSMLLGEKHQACDVGLRIFPTMGFLFRNSAIFDSRRRPTRLLKGVGRIRDGTQCMLGQNPYGVSYSDGSVGATRGITQSWDIANLFSQYRSLIW